MIVGVIGAGQMGAGIAQVSAGVGHDVLLSDIDLARAEAAPAGIAKALGQTRFDGRMAIFVLLVQHETPGAEILGQHIQLGYQGIGFGSGNDANVVQALHMRATGLDVVQEELAIQNHVIAGQETHDARIGFHA